MRGRWTSSLSPLLCVKREKENKNVKLWSASTFVVWIICQVLWRALEIKSDQKRNRCHGTFNWTNSIDLLWRKTGSLVSQKASAFPHNHFDFESHAAVARFRVSPRVLNICCNVPFAVRASGCQLPNQRMNGKLGTVGVGGIGRDKEIWKCTKFGNNWLKR